MKLNESREHSMKVPFKIEVSPKGRINKTTAIKVWKEIIKEIPNSSRYGRTFFITDSTGRETCWYLDKSRYGEIELSCEFTEDETETGRDWYNCLILDYNRYTKKYETEYESHVVESSAPRKGKLKEERLETVETYFYSYFAPYFVYGDDTGMSALDIEECKKFEDLVYEMTGCSRLAEVEADDTEFGYPSIDGVSLRRRGFLGGDICPYIFMKGNQKKEPVHEEELGDSIATDAEIFESVKKEGIKGKSALRESQEVFVITSFDDEKELADKIKEWYGNNFLKCLKEWMESKDYGKNGFYLLCLDEIGTECCEISSLKSSHYIELFKEIRGKKAILIHDEWSTSGLTSEYLEKNLKSIKTEGASVVLDLGDGKTVTV